ncbi:MAG: hypothetical protein ACOCV3_07105 [Halanaerobiales bacterium]
MGSAVAEVLIKNGLYKPFRMIGIEDTFTETGPYEELLAKYGMSVENIVKNAKVALEQEAISKKNL